MTGYDMPKRMDYEVFKEIVKEHFLSYMPEEYQDMEVIVRQLKKTNKEVDALALCPKSGRSKVFPTMHIQEMYEDYLRTNDLHTALQDAAKELEKAFKEMPDFRINEDLKKDNIILQLVNTAQNEEMLRNMPHREICDLSAIYRCVVSTGSDRFATAVISYKMAEYLGMDEEKLYNTAMENTRRMMPPVIKSMQEAIMELFGTMGTADIPDEIMPPEDAMWVITNKRKTYGAVSMLFEDGIHKLAEDLGSDLYILPSSIHEIIAIPADTHNLEDLAQIVSDVNMEQVELEERLSNQVYHYDRNLRKITLATDMPAKRLDGERPWEPAAARTAVLSW